MVLQNLISQLLNFLIRIWNVCFEVNMQFQYSCSFRKAFLYFYLYLLISKIACLQQYFQHHSEFARRLFYKFLSSHNFWISIVETCFTAWLKRSLHLNSVNSFFKALIYYLQRQTDSKSISFVLVRANSFKVSVFVRFQ